jgi:hypothetical protein
MTYSLITRVTRSRRSTVTSGSLGYLPEGVTALLT